MNFNIGTEALRSIEVNKNIEDLRMARRKECVNIPGVKVADHDELIKTMITDGASRTMIAERVGVTTPTIFRRVEKLGAEWVIKMRSNYRRKGSRYSKEKKVDC